MTGNEACWKKQSRWFHWGIQPSKLEDCTIRAILIASWSMCLSHLLQLARADLEYSILKATVAEAGAAVAPALSI